MKWKVLDDIEEVGNGYAMLKDEQKIYFGEFIDSYFLVYGDEESWWYHFSPGIKYQYVKLEVVE